MVKRKLRDARVLVTGASSGIGRALVCELGRRGARILMTARREERLQHLQHDLAKSQIKTHYVAGDITDNGLRQSLLVAAVECFGGIDILVNNAGVGAVGKFIESDEARLREIMEVNFFSPVELVRVALPILQKGINPMIVNVGSVLGHRAIPQKSEYCCAKFALHGFSDAIRAELVASKVDVLLVSPSTTRSDFFRSLLAGRQEPQGAVVSRGMPSEVVARLTANAMAAGRHEVILTSGGKLLVWLDRLCPPIMDRVVSQWGH